MSKSLFVRGSCFMLCCLVPALVVAGAQTQGQKVEKSVAQFPPPQNPPTINSISEDFQPMAVHLVLNGINFPSKYAGNNVARLIRLLPVGGSGEYHIGQTGNWTKTVLDDVLGPAIPAGRRYRIGIIQFQETPTGINNKKLISNELEFLVLMNLDHVTPSSIHSGGAEIEVTTANELGPQGAKIVKLDGQTTQVTQWPGAGGIFKVRLPAKVAKGTHDLFVEENGIAVSKKIQITVTGGK
jgi:hypothetical protein